MVKNMLPYYLCRTAFSAAFGLLLFLTGSPIWMAILLGALILGFFLWAPHSGRYAVHPEFGVSALRRDERTQAINDKAARNAFVVSMLMLVILVGIPGSFGLLILTIDIIKIVLLTGALTYFASDAWLRKAR